MKTFKEFLTEAKLKKPKSPKDYFNVTDKEIEKQSLPITDKYSKDQLKNQELVKLIKHKSLIEQNMRDIVGNPRYYFINNNVYDGDFYEVYSNRNNKSLLIKDITETSMSYYIVTDKKKFDISDCVPSNYYDEWKSLSDSLQKKIETKIKQL